LRISVKDFTGIFLSFILASILGIFGQDLASMLNRHLMEINTTYYLTFLTITSLVVYVFTFVYSYKRLRNPVLTSVTGLVGVLISCWSLFVLVMWWS